jgi:hypothetical protein
MQEEMDKAAAAMGRFKSVQHWNIATRIAAC